MLVAAPSYVTARGRPVDPDDLARHRCITLQLSSVPVRSWTLRGGGGTHEIPLTSPLCGDGYLARRWAKAGMGIALKSLVDVIDDLESGELLRVLPEVDGGDMGVHALFPSRRFLPERVRVLANAIAARFEARSTRCRTWVSEA